MDGQREEYLTQQEAADRFQVHVDTLRSWRRSGEGPQWLRLGRQVRYRASDLDAWAVQQSQKAS